MLLGNPDPPERLDDDSSSPYSRRIPIPASCSLDRMDHQAGNAGNEVDDRG